MILSAPQDRAESPLPSRPARVSELACHGWTLMSARRLVLALHAAVSTTAIVQPYREPTPPAVRPRRVGTGQGLPDLALRAEAAGPMMPRDHPCMHDVVTAKISDRLQPRCALHAPEGSPRHPTPFLLFVHLPIRPALGPAEASTTRPPWQAGGRHQRATATRCEEGRRVACLVHDQATFWGMTRCISPSQP